MIQERPTEEELVLFENILDPVCATECLFSDPLLENLTIFNENFSNVRLYQYPLLSFENTIDYNFYNISLDEQFSMRKKVADCYCYGGRLFGKTKFVQEIDMNISLMLLDNMEIGLGSVDRIHIRKVLEPVKDVFSNHPILKDWAVYIRTVGDAYNLAFKNGIKLESVNFALSGRNPGEQFFSKHFKRLYLEEQSLETPEVYDKRKDSESEFGAVHRFSGMSNFTRHSPSGKVFYDNSLIPRVINLPQYVNPTFTEEKRQQRVEQYGGESSLSYRIYVEGEIIEDGETVFDPERTRKCYDSNKTIKRFEINKERCKYYQQLLVLERPKNATQIFVSADVGDGKGGSNIIIIAEINGKYYWLYDIILYRLILTEQLDIIKYILSKMSFDYFSVDCGDALGRAIADNLENVFGIERIVRYAGVEKVDVEPEKNERGEVIFREGKPVYRQEFMSEWSIHHLRKLIYDEKLQLPLDYKFDNQITSIVATYKSNRILYECISETGDHLIDSFKVFSILDWIKKELKFNYIDSSPRSLGVWC